MPLRMKQAKGNTRIIKEKMMTTHFIISVVYLLAINLAAYLAFHIDKKASIAKRRRTPEKTLLLLALIGGSVGAITGQQTLRHKTYKQPFKFFLYTIAALHIILALMVLILGIETFSGHVYTLIKNLF